MPNPADSGLALAREVFENDTAFRLSRALRLLPEGKGIRPNQAEEYDCLRRWERDELVRRNEADEYAPTSTSRPGRPYSGRNLFSYLWLEYVVFAILQGICQADSTLIQEVAHGRKVHVRKWPDHDLPGIQLTDIDVIALMRERLVLFECKDWDVVNRDDKADDFKLQVTKVVNLRDRLGPYAEGVMVTSTLAPSSEATSEERRQSADRRRDVERYCDVADVRLIEIRPPILEPEDRFGQAVELLKKDLNRIQKGGRLRR